MDKKIINEIKDRLEELGNYKMRRAQRQVIDTFEEAQNHYVDAIRLDYLFKMGDEEQIKYIYLNVLRELKQNGFYEEIINEFEKLRSELE